jgi:hypothetical protein
MQLFNEQGCCLITYFIKYIENNLPQQAVILFICIPTVYLHVKQMTVNINAFYKIRRNYESFFEMR